MSSKIRHVSVCVCTFRRPALLKKLLDVLEHQETNNCFTYSVIVADNDIHLSARPVVDAFKVRSGIKIIYCSESRQNIALARNEALEHADGDFIATIDDDEFPEPNWLLTMLKACEEFEAAGVLGPVRPHFDEPPPRWVVMGRFCEREEYLTGRVMNWRQCWTGNLLFRHSILDKVTQAFDPKFASGGEDQDFFMRMTRDGYVFRWCNEGVVFETVPRARLTRRYMLKRALLRGKNSLKHSSGRTRLIGRSLVAAPAYLVILPFTPFFGQHVFMSYCIRCCDHLGRILALIGLNPIQER